MKVIYIMWLRQIKRYIRNKSRLIGSFGQPILFLVGFGYGFSSIYRQAGAGDYLQFLAPGVVAQGILFTSIFSGIELIWDRQFGFLKETLVAPIPRFNIMLGKTLGGATIATFQGLVILFISVVIGFRPVSLFGAIFSIIVMFVIAIVFTALGTAIASTMEDFHGFQLIMNFLVMPLFFLSGALFPLSGLPKIMDLITRINPLTYGVDALRILLSDNGHYLLSINIAILVFMSVTMLTIGGYLFRKIQL